MAFSFSMDRRPLKETGGGEYQYQLGSGALFAIPRPSSSGSGCLLSQLQSTIAGTNETPASKVGFNSGITVHES